MMNDALAHKLRQPRTDAAGARLQCEWTSRSFAEAHLISIGTVAQAGAFVETDVTATDTDAATRHLEQVETRLAVDNHSIVNLPYRDLVMAAADRSQPSRARAHQAPKTQRARWPQPKQLFMNPGNQLLAGQHAWSV